ncbi:MAG TPA: TetR/AcrR family transcriptional regulator [Nocardioides sp.]|uniref:TetR/AcrR family transcriptional regulator n=1 Tax=Nocardioides sp. TaxID=35761 RepID=UPI002E2FBE30|nr:TetR/AcrR family transcriptional regulator [Nocardioides sp.]HEX5087824.1 TetR/AcrR family transcriptional regulator [Nocardioides sp.]
MPRLWTTTIETHRHEVRAAVVQATGQLVAERGLKGVSMSAIAQLAGIGRATLYRYYPDVDAILNAWHEDQVTGHVERLLAISEQAGPAIERLRRVLAAYAESRQHSSHEDAADLVASLHASQTVHHHLEQLTRVVEGLIETAARDGDARGDVPPAELATFALAAMSSAAHSKSKNAISRLLAVTFDALSPRATRA